jgi:dTMP kinase
MKGLFITLEGGEGTGKTTQLRWLEELFRERGRRVLLTREPGGSPVAEQIRRILLDPENASISPRGELLLYAAARAQHVDEVIRPALQRGDVVISDRFADSTTAYQGAGRGIPLEEVNRLHAIATNGVWPDLTLVIDLPAEEGLRRAGRVRERDRLEQEPLAFHRRVREEFLRLAELDPGRVKVVDGSRPPDDVARAIREHVDALLQDRASAKA